MDYQEIDEFGDPSTTVHVHVGRQSTLPPRTTSHEETHQPMPSDVKSSSSPAAPSVVSFQELENMMEQFRNKIDQTGAQNVEEADCSMATAENERQNWITLLNKAYASLLRLVKYRAGQIAHTLLDKTSYKKLPMKKPSIIASVDKTTSSTDTTTNNSAANTLTTNRLRDEDDLWTTKSLHDYETALAQLTTLLHVEPATKYDWQRKRNQLLDDANRINQQQQNMAAEIDAETAPALARFDTIDNDPAPCTYVAAWLNSLLTQQQALLQYTLQELQQFHKSENALLRALWGYYLLSTSRMLEQCSDRFAKMNRGYDHVQEQLARAFEKNTAKETVDALATEFDVFLQNMRPWLPLEFALSDQARLEERKKENATETLQTLKTELAALLRAVDAGKTSDTHKALLHSLHIWKRKLDNFDDAHLRSVEQEKCRLQAMLANAMQDKTFEQCATAWDTLLQRLLSVGIALQSRANEEFFKLRQQSSERLQQIQTAHTALRLEIRAREAQLALTHARWAAQLQQRKQLLNEWSKLQCWVATIDGLLLAMETAEEFQRKLLNMPKTEPSEQ